MAWETITAVHFGLEMLSIILFYFILNISLIRFRVYLFFFRRYTFPYLCLALRNGDTVNVNITKNQRDVEAFRDGGVTGEVGTVRGLYVIFSTK